MKKNKIPVSLVLALVAVLGTTSCQKESINPSTGKTTTSGPEKKPTYSDGIRSNNGYSVDNQTDVAFYELVGQSIGQQPIMTYGYGGLANTSVKGYGACAAHEAIAYKDGSETMLAFDGGIVWVSPNGVDSFVPYIQEIEINPVTLEVYAVATTKSVPGAEIYHINKTTGIATLILSLSASSAGVSGTISFVPNGINTELVYTYETGTAPYTTLHMTHYLATPTSLSGVSSHSYPMNVIPAGTGLNTTFGNGKLYIARNGGNLYSLPVPLSGSGTATLEVSSANFNNQNDFGYWKSF